jgi:hypothetical protein
MAKKAQVPAPAPAPEKEAEKPAIAKTTVPKGASAVRIKTAADARRVEMQDRAKRLYNLMSEKSEIDELIKQEKAALMQWATDCPDLFAGKSSFVIEQIKVAWKTENEIQCGEKFNRALFLSQYPDAVKFSFVMKEMKNIDYGKWSLSESASKKLEVGKA